MPHEAVDWIAEHQRPFADLVVGSLVPAIFDRYARVLHPAWTSTGPEQGAAVRWAAVAAWSGRTIHAHAQWELLARPIDGVRGQAPFVAPPDEGGLPRAGLAALCDVLASHTGTPDGCCVGTWEGYGSPMAECGGEMLDLDSRAFHVRRGPLGLALEVGCTLLWPEDRAWFVASDPDLDSTYLGGSDALVSVILATPELEAWPVEPTDGITAGSDDVNVL